MTMKHTFLSFYKGLVMSNLINKLKNMFTAIAYAEAGDLDAVKQILQAEYKNKPEREQNAGSSSTRQPAIPAI